MINSLKVNVKSSSTKSSLNNDNITIDAKHSDMINYFKNLNDSIPLLKEELKKLVLEYNNKDSSRKNDIEYISLAFFVLKTDFQSLNVISKNLFSKN